MPEGLALQMSDSESKTSTIKILSDTNFKENTLPVFKYAAVKAS